MAADLDGLRYATVELVRRIRAEISERLAPRRRPARPRGETGFQPTTSTQG